MYKKDIFKNAQENFDNSRINPSLSSTKEYDDLLSFIKNTKEGLIQIDVYSVFQIFSIFFFTFHLLSINFYIWKLNFFSARVFLDFIK